MDGALSQVVSDSRVAPFLAQPNPVAAPTLMFSSPTPFQQFGIVTAITIAYALIAAVVVVPPAMILWAAYQDYRLRSTVARAEREMSGSS